MCVWAKVFDVITLSSLLVFWCHFTDQNSEIQRAKHLARDCTARYGQSNRNQV